MDALLEQMILEEESGSSKPSRKSHDDDDEQEELLRRLISEQEKQSKERNKQRAAAAEELGTVKFEVSLEASLAEAEAISSQKRMIELKEKGVAAYKAGDFFNSVKLYTVALSLPYLQHKDIAILHSNRAAAQMGRAEHYGKSSKQGCECAELALKDADETIHHNSKWFRGFYRRGKALHALGQLREALEALNKGIALESDNQELWSARREVEDDARKLSIPLYDTVHLNDANVKQQKKEQEQVGASLDALDAILNGGLDTYYQ